MPRPPLGEKAMTDVERQRKRRERLLKERDAELDAAASASDDPRLAAALRENVRLRQRLRDKRQELESLNGLTRQQRRTTKNSFRSWEEIAKRIKPIDLSRLFADVGGMSFETSSKIAKALHPDYKPSDQERAEAFKAYSQWKQEGSKARRRESTPQAPATFRRSP